MERPICASRRRHPRVSLPDGAGPAGTALSRDFPSGPPLALPSACDSIFALHQAPIREENMATAVLAWAGESFASGAASAAGGMAFNHLVTVLGIVEDPTQKIREQLTEISAKLDAVARDIATIDRRIGELAKQLDLIKLELDKRIEEKVISAAVRAFMCMSYAPTIRWSRRTDAKMKDRN
jgi:hypothetical protein